MRRQERVGWQPDRSLAYVLQTMHSEPLTKWCVPWLVVDEFYQGRQEDTDEFLDRLLNPEHSLCIRAPFVGHDAPELTCPSCLWTRAAAEESFTGQQVPLV